VGDACILAANEMCMRSRGGRVKGRPGPARECDFREFKDAEKNLV
jgi:hypothetical protein